MRRPPKNLPYTRSDLRLLIVDDDEDFAGSLADILEPRGYEVVLAHNAKSAMEAVHNFDARVALIDIRLDRSNGIELISKLRDVRANILCVMMTAYVGIETAIEALHQGAYDYLRKPLNAQDLFATLDRCFEKLRLEHEKEQAEKALMLRNKELEEVNERLRKIVESAKKLAAHSQYGEITPLLLEEFARNMAAQGGSLFLRNEDALVLVHSLDPGHAPSRLSFPLRKGSVMERVMTTRQPVLIKDFAREEHLAPSGWDGYKDASSLAFPLHDDTGEIVGIVTIHNRAGHPFTQHDQDLGGILASYCSETLRATRAIQALRGSEEKYRTILESIKEAYFEVDLSGNFTFFNDSTCEILGYSRDELSKMNRRACASPQASRKTDGIFDEICSTGNPAVMLDHEIVRKDGSIGMLEMSASLMVDASGLSAGIRCVARDISDRKRAEEERQRLATAIEHAAESIIITDKDGTIQYVNPACELISGYNREEVIGLNFSIFTGSGPDDNFFRKMWKTLIGGGVWNGQIVNRKKDSSLCEFETTISPIRDDAGAITSFVSVNRDVTQEEQLKRQLLQAQKMEAVGTLAGGIAHDFNNILQAILGYSELLFMGKKEGERGYRELCEILSAAKRGAELIQQLLSFSRKLESNKRPLLLNNEVKQVIKLLARTIPKMIEIELHLDEELKIINADPVQIQQTLMNLAVNAKDAMQNGGKLIIATENVSLDEEYCRAQLRVKPGDYVLLSISDTGHGMDNGTRERIFEPFFSTKPAGRGTGLGLAMAYVIVSSHGGSIVCESQPGKGATFLIYLPAAKHDAVFQMEPEPNYSISMGQETVLLVDDEEAIRDFGKQLLSSYGYKVLTAPDGERALEIYRKEGNRIDLIILDIIMPGMGGNKCLDELLKLNPEVKILISSGYAPEDTTYKALQSGAKTFIHKPFELKRLLKILREVIESP